MLSRGLTLEGLTVSYFNRSVTASDTLMQMARWFGYRDGYQDLCRLWINPDAADDYRFAAESVEELRADLRRMFQQRLTPAEFGLAVRKHPNSLLITARNKMKSAKSTSAVISLAGRRLETTSLLVDPDVVSSNRSAFTALMSSIGSETKFETSDRGWPLFSAVDRAHVAEFLDATRLLLRDPYFSGTTLSGWVRRSKARQLQTWDVVIAQGQQNGTAFDLPWGEVRLPRRKLVLQGGVVRVSGSSRRLAGRSDLSQLVPRSTKTQIEEAYRASYPDRPGCPRSRSTPALLRPALLVYLLEGSDDAYSLPSPLVALKVAIPGDTTDVHNRDTEVEYVINTVAQQEWITEFTGADDDDVDD